MTTAGNHSKQNTNSSCFGQGIAVDSFKTRFNSALLEESKESLKGLDSSKIYEEHSSKKLSYNIAYSCPPTTSSWLRYSI